MSRVGLTNSPPLTRKKVHAHTSNERPNESEMYSNWEGFTSWLIAVSDAELVGVLATLVPDRSNGSSRRGGKAGLKSANYKGREWGRGREGGREQVLEGRESEEFTSDGKEEEECRS